MPGHSRRAFITGAAAFAAAAWLPRRAAAQSAKTKLILLARGGPRPRKASSAPAQVIVSNDVAYVIDCGNGVARQLVFAGVPLTRLRHVFITHHHSDHNADYGNLIWLRGPPGCGRESTRGDLRPREMTRLFFEMNAYDISTRIADEAGAARSAGPRPRIDPGGSVMQDENVKVTRRCHHRRRAIVRLSVRRGRPLDRHLRRYRASTISSSLPGRGRSRPRGSLCAGVDRLVARVPMRPPSSRASCRTTPRRKTQAGCAGRRRQAPGALASRARDDPAITDQMWIDAPPAFPGPVIVGKDLLEI